MAAEAGTTVMVFMAAATITATTMTVATTVLGHVTITALSIVDGPVRVGMAPTHRLGMWTTATLTICPGAIARSTAADTATTTQMVDTGILPPTEEMAFISA
jgi:hypothetical protein